MPRKSEPKKAASWPWKTMLPKRPLLLLAGVIVTALFLLGPRLLSLSYGNLDPSFNYAVNNAAAAKEAFGTQFIATYGPLGYLVSNYLPDNVARVTIWLGIYVLLLALGVYLFVMRYVKPGRFQWLAAGALVYALAAASNGVSVEWGYLATFLLYCFVLIKLSPRQQLCVVPVMAAFAAIFSLTKFTLGFSALASLLVVCLLSIDGAWRSRLLRGGLAAGSYAVAFLGLGRFLGIASFPDYIKTALIESGNFNTAMSLYDKHTAFATWMAATALALLVIWPLLHSRKDFLRYVFIAPALAIMWKYAIVRQDGHILRLMQLVVPLAIIIFLVWAVRTRKDRWMLGAVVLASAFAIWANRLPFSGNDSFAAVVTSPLVNVQKGNYISYFNIPSQKREWAEQSAAGLGGARLPQTMRDKIGDKGVDVFPWETAIVAANNLTWQNRPSPFSFETYDPFLDDLNTDYFTSAQAPEFVVWHDTGVSSIDGRHILWDEPKTIRALLSDYEVVETDQHFMLLQKRPDGQERKLAVQNLQLGELPVSKKHWVDLKGTDTGRLGFGYFTVHKTPADKLQTTVVRGEDYYLVVKYKNGDIRKYRFVAENSQQGLLLNGLPKTWKGLVQLMQTGAVPSAGNEVVQIKLVDN